MQAAGGYTLCFLRFNYWRGHAVLECAAGFQAGNRRYLVIIAALFSVFCYMRELQHLGNALIRMGLAVTHFEIYGSEPVELAQFYRSVFGWTVEQMPGVDYWRNKLGASDADVLAGGITYRAITGLNGWTSRILRQPFWKLPAYPFPRA